MKVFISYSHKDKRYRTQLDTHLALLKREEVIEVWHDRKITAGREWAHQIDENLEQASIILLLISSDFLASDYCYDKEMGRALEKHNNGEARVIPIIIRSADWSTAQFAKIQALPQEGKPVDSWRKKDEAWTDVAKGIRKVVEELSGRSTPPPIQEISEPRKPVWNIPLERNPFFTGRENILGEIREALLSSGRAAFSGLGGIGKTQTAIEYAYRHKDDYSHILWVKADSKESLTLDFAQLGSILNLPEKNAQDQQEVVNAVQRWLKQHEHWLLILDNADDLSLIQPFIQGLQSGHILLTTRAQATGTISRIEVRELPEQEGVAFLFRRAKLIAKDTSYETIPQDLRTQALAIVRELDSLPLALDQAGAYIEETQCGLADYLELYRTHGVDLLRERGLFAPGHPDPVTTTWVLSFQKIEQANPAAAELLTFCAFLYPEGIPEELITEGASELGPILEPAAGNPLSFNNAVGDILKFSLIHRDMDTHTLDIHRLVQSVILASLDDETRNQWIVRLIRAMNVVFPDVKFENWGQCDRILSQAKQCAMLILNKNLILPEGALVLHQTGYYLTERARYDEANPLFQCALAIREQALGSTHLAVATSLNNLASLYWKLGKYAEAEPLLQRALAIQERALGPTHPDVANSLNNLGELYRIQGKYPETEPLHQRALAIREEALGHAHPHVATTLNNLAILYQAQGRHADAEPLHQRALAIREEALGPTHPHVATTLNNLAILYQAQGRHADAETLHQRALAIREEALGPTHPDVANSLNNLGELYRAQGKYPEAKLYYQRARAIREEVLGPTHPSLAESLNSLASLYSAQGQYPKAKPLYQRALAIQEEALGPTHPSVAESLNSLASLYQAQGQYPKAKPLYQRALAIREQALGPTHPDVAKSLNDLGELYRAQGKYTEAEPLSLRALAIWEETLGPAHPHVATSLNNLAGLFHRRRKYSDVQPLYQRALAIRESVLGPTHPKVANSLNNLGGLYYDQKQYADAEPLLQRALNIFEEVLGSEHPTTQKVRGNYEGLLNKMKRENA